MKGEDIYKKNKGTQNLRPFTNLVNIRMFPKWG